MFHVDFRMPKIVARFIRFRHERPQTLIVLIRGQKNESFVTVTELGENPHTLFIFHEDFRMPKIVARFIRFSRERPQTRIVLIRGQKNESLVTVSELGERPHTLFIFHDDFRMPKIVASSSVSVMNGHKR